MQTTSDHSSKRQQKAKTVRLELTREEIVCVREALNLDLDITDGQLDDPRLKQDLDFSRGRALNKRILLDQVIQKVHKAFQASSR